MTDRGSGESDRLRRVWPRNMKGRRNYRYADLKLLSNAEWAELRRLIRKRLGPPVGPGARKASRTARSILRAMRVKPGGNPRDRLALPPRMLIGRMQESAILDALHPTRRTAWLPVLKRRKRGTVILKNFSLVDNPSGVFEELGRIAKAEADHASLRIDFVGEGCFDVSAYLVLGLMRQRMIRFVDGGLITGTVGAMIRAVDLADFVGVRQRVKHADPTFVPFKVRHRRPAGSSTAVSVAFQPSTAEMLADDLVTTIDRWLETCSRPRLAPDMMAWVANLVTEVLDNAVRHSDLAKSDGDWVIAGFLSAAQNPDEPGRHSYFCSLAMASVGATIYESLSQCADPPTAEALGHYLARHQLPPEVLTSVFAMQDGVSRFSQGEGDSKGGVGLMDTVEFMNRLGVSARDYERPCMTLVSGQACLRVSGPYQRSPTAAGGRRELWFNNGNTGEEPPDELYAHMLPHRFPGTIVALRFCIGAEDVAAEER